MLSEYERGQVKRLLDFDKRVPDFTTQNYGALEQKLIEGLKQKVYESPLTYSDIYFSEGGKAFVVGIIDPLTEYDLKKKSAYIFKTMRFGTATTEEGYPGISSQPADVYAERFKDFIVKRFPTKKQSSSETK